MGCTGETATCLKQKHFASLKAILYDVRFVMGHKSCPSKKVGQCYVALEVGFIKVSPAKEGCNLIFDV